MIREMLPLAKYDQVVYGWLKCPLTLSDSLLVGIQGVAIIPLPFLVSSQYLHGLSKLPQKENTYTSLRKDVYVKKDVDQNLNKRTRSMGIH